MDKKLPRHRVLDQQEAASEECTRELEGTELEYVSGGKARFTIVILYGVANLSLE